MRLIPDLDKTSVWQFKINWQHHTASLKLQIEERFKYTTSLRISYNSGVSSLWLKPSVFMVRLYHDSNTAEVVCTRQWRQLQGKYEYPNQQMHSPDEKLQCNLYLGEWLSECFKHGHTKTQVLSD